MKDFIDNNAYNYDTDDIVMDINLVNSLTTYSKSINNTISEAVNKVISKITNKNTSEIISETISDTTREIASKATSKITSEATNKTTSEATPKFKLSVWKNFTLLEKEQKAKYIYESESVKPTISPLNCETHWNATYLILQSVIEIKNVVVRIKDRDKTFSDLPKDNK
ncbi:19170_t:CDS:2 [Dentiscutata erythropus]|uniref:19170_t:CDS:1 n=1 Tax=Dentiscutata erythropus TaxID=1348616 RepID=A0A9N9INC7_9GLOM|nr:19170_t:CDS:2 [Dentiscutata erythropus]